ncbi:MAG: hypothetical protein WC967_16205 [Balneolaceae bacterium]|jgi:hypothetical protein
MSSYTIEWLPPELDLDDKTYTQIIATLYNVFQMDIKCGNLFFCGTKVGYRPGYKQNGMGYEKIFWHLIEKEEESGEELIDFPRAKKLPWFKPTIENFQDFRVKVWDNQEADKKKGIRTYIWLENLDYLIILQRTFLKKNNIEVMNIITTFHIDGPSYRRKVFGKWQKRIATYQ